MQDGDRPEHRIISCLSTLMQRVARLTYKRAPGKAHSRQIAVKLRVSRLASTISAACWAAAAATSIMYACLLVVSHC